jgi:hypothetical protein
MTEPSSEDHAPAVSLSEPSVFTATLNWTVQFRVPIARILASFEEAGGLPPKRPRRPHILAVQTTMRSIVAPEYTEMVGRTSKFNTSSVEVHIAHNRSVYKLRCFPATGNHQLPGARENDLSDGKTIICHWLRTLEDLGLGRPDPKDPIDPKTGTRAFPLLKENISLMNGKFRLRSSAADGDNSLNVRGLKDVLTSIANAEGAPRSPASAKDSSSCAGGAGSSVCPSGLVKVPPPFTIKNLTSDVKGQKITVVFERPLPQDRVEEGKRIDVTPQVSINSAGRFTLLGEKSFHHIVLVRDFFEEVLNLSPELVRRRKGPSHEDEDSETDDETVSRVLRSGYIRATTEVAAGIMGMTAFGASV